MVERVNGATGVGIAEMANRVPKPGWSEAQSGILPRRDRSTFRSAPCGLLRFQSGPYRLRPCRQLLPTRALLAAKVAPHRSRLSQVMPPVRSQSRAAAGRQGAKSFKLIA